MQIVFQDPFASLNPRMTVSEAIAAPLLVQKIFSHKDKAGIDKKVYEIMDMVGLANRLVNTYPHELDGGRRQSDRHCPGPGAEPQIHRLRRACFGSGRVHSGPDSEPDAGLQDNLDLTYLLLPTI